MDTLVQLSGWLVPFLVLLTVVVFVHELGHFLVARWCGVGIKTFSIGFGPEIAGYTDRHRTRWKLSWIPLGGYVKFIDDENAASAGQKSLEQLTTEERKHSFQAKSLGQRAAIVAAGPLANFLLAVVIFSSIYAFFGEQVTAPKVDVVVEGSAAQRAGFLPGDLVVSIDGRAIESFGEMQQIIGLSAGTTRQFVVERQGKQIELTATPEIKEVTDRFGNKLRIAQLGIQRNAGAAEWTSKRYDPLSAIAMGIKKTYFLLDSTVRAIFGIATGRESADQLGGPIRIAQLSGQIFSIGYVDFINFIGILSVGIGFINLLPIPILDGGHLLFYSVEAIRGRPLSERTQEIGFRIGFVFIVMLMLLTVKNDVNWGALFRSLG